MSVDRPAEALDEVELSGPAHRRRFGWSGFAARLPGSAAAMVGDRGTWSLHATEPPVVVNQAHGADGLGFDFSLDRSRRGRLADLIERSRRAAAWQGQGAPLDPPGPEAPDPRL